MSDLRAGDQVHVLRAVTWFKFRDESAGVVVTDQLSRGQTITLTSDSIRHNPEALANIDVEGAALARGSWPEDEPTWERRGDPVWAAAREAARQEAWKSPTEAGRLAALAEVERRFGPALPTSRTLGSLYGGRPVDSAPVPRGRADALA